MAAKQTVVIPAIFETHKNQLRPSKHGGFYLDQKAKKQREALILYLNSLVKIPEEYAVGVNVVVDLSDHSTAVTFEPLGLYDHKKCPDLDGIVSAVLDAAQVKNGAGIIHNDNRIKLIRAEIK